jgi:hypothetical protein
LFVTVISRLLGADLTPASRRQNHTTSPSASAPFVKCAARVHRIPPRVVDVRNAPLLGRDSDRYRSDLGRAETEIFLQKGLDKPFRKTRSDLPVRQNQSIGFDKFHADRDREKPPFRDAAFKHAPVPSELAVERIDLATLMFNYHDLGHLGVDRAR